MVINFPTRNYTACFLQPLLVIGLLMLSGCVVIPAPIDSNYNRGVEAYDEGRLADAIRFYKLELEQNPEHHLARYNLAVTYQDQKKYDQAEAEYRKILEAHEDTDARINLASIYYARGQKGEAFQLLEQAVKNNPDDPNPHSVLGHYLEEAGEQEKARQHYLAALAIDEKHAETHFRLGRLNRKIGLVRDAEVALLEAVALDDKQSHYLELLADHYVKENDLPAAADMLERVSVLEPDRADIFVRLGDLYKKMGYTRQAADRYWEAAGIEPDNAAIHRNLRELFETLATEEKQKLESLEQGQTVAQSPST